MISISELAERLGIDRSIVYRRIARENIPTIFVYYRSNNEGVYQAIAVSNANASKIEKLYRDERRFVTHCDQLPHAGDQEREWVRPNPGEAHHHHQGGSS